MDASFAWPSVNVICGQCHFIMDGSISKNDFPVEYRVKCPNPKCENFGKIFRLPKAAAFQLEEITDEVYQEVANG